MTIESDGFAIQVILLAEGIRTHVNIATETVTLEATRAHLNKALEAIDELEKLASNFALSDRGEGP